MEGDDVIAVWRRYDARLDEIAATNALILRGMSVKKTHAALGPLRRTLAYELAIGAVAVFVLGTLAAGHVHDRAVFAATVVLDVCAIAAFAVTIAQFVALGRIDFDQPVLSIARAIERLRLLRARQNMWTLVLAPLLWPPFAIVVARDLLGVDPIAAFGLPWLLANMAFGIAVLALAVWLARRYGRAANAAPWFRRFSESLSGKAARSATHELETLSLYENGEITMP